MPTSRLPRLRSSSPDPHHHHQQLTSEEPVPTLASAVYVNTRKRKSNIIDDDDDSLDITNPAQQPSRDDDGEAQDKLGELGVDKRPKKVAAIGGTGSSRPTRGRTVSASAAASGTGAKGKGPLGPSKTTPNLGLNSSGSSDKGGTGTKVPTLSSSNFGKGLPKSGLSTSRPPPTLSRSTTTRGTSAPPASSSGSGSGSGGRGAVRVPVTRKPPSAGGATAPPPRGVGRTLRSGTTTSTTARPGTKPVNQLTTIQEQLASLEAARQADTLRLAQEMASERTKLTQLQSHQIALSKQLTEAKSLELNQRRELVTYADEMDEMRRKFKTEIMELEIELRKKEREAREMSEDLRVTRGDLDRERASAEHLRSTLHTQAQMHLTLSAENAALKTQLGSLQREVESKDEEVRDMRVQLEEKEKRVVQMKKEVFESETIRRKLHNMVLELKGNIRVFCRVRPVLPSDYPASAGRIEELNEEVEEEVKANMAFPDKRDHKEIVLYSSSESAMGNERKEVYSFGFDRVFEPTSTQSEVFEEISQLAQSCIDGYNVCIFAYGQTGSGKSFTMEGGNSDSTAGMIPRAVEQVFRVAEEMKSKGWEYKIEGQFLEIYNESIHDLLSTSTSSSEPSKKHEIKHDPKSGRTTVTELTVVPLTSASQVKSESFGVYTSDMWGHGWHLYLFLLFFPILLPIPICG
ncbi:hypothetical protein MD484_g4347, partial [Candolleomyces efflorescens]